MTLWEAITAAREGYLAAFRAAIREQRSKLRDLRTEEWVTPPGAEDVPEAFRSFRIDLLWQQDGKPMAGAFDAAAAGIGGMCTASYPDGQEVSVLFLRWDDCEFHCSPRLDLAPALTRWFGEWNDRAGRHGVDRDGLRSAVHSITPPGVSAGRSAVVFAVDFGSAPAEAFTSLIATLFAAGVTRIQVGA